MKLMIDENACHKGQSKRAGRCKDAKVFSGACACTRSEGHDGRCSCGYCGRRFRGVGGGS